MRRVGTDLDLWWGFLESKGLSSGRMAQEERFREHFPTGEYAKYEPDMRKRLAELFLETGLLPTATNDEERCQANDRCLVAVSKPKQRQTMSGCADISTDMLATWSGHKR